MKKVIFFVFLICWLTFSLCCQGQTVKEYASTFSPKSVVTDFTNVLRESEAKKLTQLIDSIEATTGIEYAICIINSLDNHDSRQLATEIGNLWGVGKKYKNNGILILISVEDKETFMATGLGVSEVLPDSTVKVLVDRYLVPNLREGDFCEGLSQVILQTHNKLGALYILDENPNSFWKPWMRYFLATLSICALIFMLYDFIKLGGFDPETKKFPGFKRRKDGLLGGSDSSSGDGGSFGGDFGGDGD